MTSTAEPVSTPRRGRSRLALVAIGVMVIASNVYFAIAAKNATSAMEARAIAGDFPIMRQEAGPATITEDGRVYGHGAGTDPTGYVASTHLIPAGTYRVLVVAEDGNEAHKQKAKAELVIAGRDDKGAWHPASAEKIAARLAPPTTP